jgi:acetoin utilization deacetylase AcuC-like enzyme
MLKTGLVYHEGCLRHRLNDGQFEIPERVSLTHDYFAQSGLLQKLDAMTPDPATHDNLERVHTEELINYVKERSESGYEPDALVNGDVSISEGTYQSAVLAAGGVKMAAEAVCAGTVNNAFALVRPPGHHASRTLPSGFCFFNNSAVAIRHIQQRMGIERVAVFDWDAHCGHGTMSVFYDDPDVLTISIHQDPKNFFPGTGFVDQIGEGDGMGYCMNIPVPAGTGNADYVYAMDNLVIPALKRFKPQAIFVAAGQDGHVNDKISGLKLTDEGYMAMTGRILKAANSLCKGRLVLTLEGGYNLQTLPRTNHAIVSTLAGLAAAPAVSGEVLESTKAVLQKLRDQLADTPMRI